MGHPRTDLWIHQRAYLALALAITWTLIRHLRRPLPLVPADWLGKGQLLYLVFLWWMVIGNFDRAQVTFAPQRLVTEGVIHVNAVICTAMVLMCARGAVPLSFEVVKDYRPLIRRAVVMGAAGLAVSVLLQWGIVRAVYGDQFAGYSGKHIRFGPNATATNKKPVSGQPHP